MLADPRSPAPRGPRLRLSTDGERQLEEAGWTFVADFVGLDGQRTLLEAAAPFIAASPRGFCNTVFWPDSAERFAAGQRIRDTLGPSLATLAADARMMLGVFCIKPVGEDSGMFPHQDWSVVDDASERSYTLWLALTDVTPDSGPLEVLEGSHRRFPGPRGPGIPPNFGPEGAVAPRFRPLPMPPGTAVVMDHALVHRSGPNRSAGTRLAAMTAFFHQDAPARHYLGRDGPEGRCIDVFEVSEEVRDHYLPDQWISRGQRVYSK